LGGGVPSDTRTIRSDETRTIGTTGRKPATLVPPAVRARTSIPPIAHTTFGGPGGGTGTTCWKNATAPTPATTDSVAASAPHFVLRFQKSAATRTGQSAA